METLFSTETQTAMQFPKSLTELYAPKDIDSFIGIPKVKKVCKAFSRQPREACLLFVGDSGTGKSLMARAIARAINGELHVISSAKCDKESLENLARICSYVPFCGGWHVNVLEEADLMSPAAAAWLLTRTDDTSRLERTVWILTCNSVERMEDRLLSRCLRWISSAMALALKPYLCSSVFGRSGLRRMRSVQTSSGYRAKISGKRFPISKSKSWQRRDYLDIPWRPVCRLVSRFDGPSGEQATGPEGAPVAPWRK